MGVPGQFLYIWLIYAGFGLNLGNPVLGGLLRLKEMALYYNMKMVRSNENNNIIYSNSMKTNRNELIRRLLSGITKDELENLLRVREEARRPIPAPRKWGSNN